MKFDVCLGVTQSIDPVAFTGIDSAVVGEKASSLMTLPAAWRPAFFVLRPSDRDDHDDAIASELTLLRKRSRDRVIVRSSATNESLERRGQLVSYECDLEYSEVINAACKVVQQHRDISSDDEIAIIVQEFIPAKALGHLSNESRVSKESTTWLAERMDAEGNFEGCWKYTVKFSKPQFQRTPLECLSEDDVYQRLTEVGYFLRARKKRSHLEWVWGEGRLWIVQLDTEVLASGVSPFQICTQSKGSSFAAEVTLSRAAGSPNPWKKVDALRQFQAAGLQVPDIYIIEGKDSLSAIASGQISEDIERSLRALSSAVLVIRTDRITKSEDAGFYLPRTDSIQTFEDAKDFLISTAGSFVQKGVSTNEFCFLLHQFVPAVGSAFAFAKPNVPRVRIDATWGLPDSLGYFPHDSFEFDLDEDRIVGKKIRGKTSILCVDSGGKWVERPCKSKWIFSQSLTEGQVRTIAEGAATLAANAEAPLGVMFFCGLCQNGLSETVLPWFVTRDVMQVDVSTQYSGRAALAITSPKDLDILELQESEATSKRRVIAIHPSADFIRDTALLERVASFAASHSMTIELQGSILSHAYYILIRAGARVRCTDPLMPTPARRQYAGKLVRDGIPERIRSRGGAARVVKASSAEMIDRLKQKLIEEAFEVRMESEPGALAEELSDVVEVVKALSERLGEEFTSLLERASNKRSSRGGFSSGYLLYESESLPLLHEPAAAKGLFDDNTEWRERRQLPTRPSEPSASHVRVVDAPELTINLDLIPPISTISAPASSSHLVQFGGTRLQIVVEYHENQVSIAIRSPAQVAQRPKQLVLFPEGGAAP